MTTACYTTSHLFLFQFCFNFLAFFRSYFQPFEVLEINEACNFSICACWSEVYFNRKRTFPMSEQWCLSDFYTIIYNGDKTLRNVNVVVRGQAKREKSSLPVAVRLSKTCALKLPIQRALMK